MNFIIQTFNCRNFSVLPKAILPMHVGYLKLCHSCIWRYEGHDFSHLGRAILIVFVKQAQPDLSVCIGMHEWQVLELYIEGRDPYGCLTEGCVCFQTRANLIHSWVTCVTRGSIRRAHAEENLACYTSLVLHIEKQDNRKRSFASETFVCGLDATNANWLWILGEGLCS